MMEFFSHLIDFILHLDKYLHEIITNYGTWTYLILFLIIFVETGVVVMPFLPGDSLLFAVGAIAANGTLDLLTILVLLFAAAVLGDTLNYFIGKKVGPAAFKRDYRFLKRAHLLKTQAFYERYGAQTVILARFVPIVRTFAPFVAGIGTMNYRKFGAYNIIGGFLWVVIFTFLGYFFGNLPYVKKNFTLVIFAIIVISLLPPLVEVGKQKWKNRRSKNQNIT